MPRHRSRSVAFERQVAEESLAGETLHGLAKRHDNCRNLIRVWLARYQAGAFDDDAQTADLRQAYGARIAALERLVGKQALELELLKGPRAAHLNQLWVADLTYVAIAAAFVYLAVILDAWSRL